MQSNLQRISTVTVQNESPRKGGGNLSVVVRLRATIFQVGAAECVASHTENLSGELDPDNSDSHTLNDSLTCDARAT